MFEPVFHDCHGAGQLLALRLQPCALAPNPVVLALRRGGVPVGFEVARAYGAPLDVFIVPKLGVPGPEEMAMRALASDGVLVLNYSVIDQHSTPPHPIERVAAGEQAELGRPERACRNNRPPLDVKEATVILVDDGFATGASLPAAIEALPAPLIPAEKSRGPGVRTYSHNQTGVRARECQGSLS